MTQGYTTPRGRRRRDTQPLAIAARPRERDPSITALGFTCFKLVPIHALDGDAPQLAALPDPASRNRMAVFAFTLAPRR